MIYKKCIMTIAKNGATLDEDIYLYRLDKNIELHFTIVNNKYKFDKSDLNNIIAQTQAAYFQVRLYKNADIKYTFAIQPTQDGVAVLTITDDLIDDPIEVGEYDFQISLLDADKTSMISMPIVSKQLHVCEPLVSDTAVMGKAVLGLSKAAKGEIKNAFDSQGNYIREIHNDGEIISAQMFNKFEEALETNTKAIKAGTGGTGTSYDDTAIKADIQTLKDNQVNLVEDETSMDGIKDNEYPTLTTTNKTLIGSINEVNAQCKKIANKTIIEGNKIYLAKADGTKIDSGTELPLGGNSAYGGTYTTLDAINADSNVDKTKYYVLTSGDNAGYTAVYDTSKSSWVLGWNMGNSSSGTTEGKYDTEVVLPYSATKDTDIELTFSTGNIGEYNNLCLSGEDISQYVIQDVGSPTSAYDIVNDSEKGNCLHYKNSGTTGYTQLKLFSSNSWDSTHYYYVSYWVKMVKQTSNISYSDYPKFICGTNVKAGSNTYDHSNTTSWQRVSFITQPASYLTTGIGFNIMADGEFYFKPIIILDIDGLGYDTSNPGQSQTWGSYITDLDTKVLLSTLEFSCIVNNGGTKENIEEFKTGDKIYYYTIQKNKVLSIEERSGYNMPTILAKIKGNGTNQDNVEDIDIKISTRFAGKKVVFEGDSITDSDYNPAYNGKSWADYLANKLKMTIASNMALGGSSISTYNSAGSVVTRITSNSYPSDTKLFCIMAGTNDWNSNVALGDIGSTDTSTILGALNTIIDHLQTNYPDATIVIMTPMHRSGMRTATRTAGTLSDVAKAYEEVCMNWGVNCVNTLKEFGINAYNTTVANKFYVEQDSNWLHPNPEGHKRIAIRMAGYISTL